jgi:hypothetical protein
MASTEYFISLVDLFQSPKYTSTLSSLFKSSSSYFGLAINLFIISNSFLPNLLISSLSSLVKPVQVAKALLTEENLIKLLS